MTHINETSAAAASHTSNKALAATSTAATMAVVLLAVGAVAFPALVPSQADAKTLSAKKVEKRIEKSVTKGKTWVKFKRSEKVRCSKIGGIYYKARYSSATHMIKVRKVQFWKYGNTKYSYGIKLTYYKASERKKLKTAAKRVALGALLQPTEADKIRTIHDAICALDSYDYPSYYSGNYTAHDHDAYGCLVKGSSVCAGYAEAFQLCALSSGLKSSYLANGSHAWNLARVNGSWYHIDCTWDDGDEVKYNYFLKGAATMSTVKSHSVVNVYPTSVKISDVDWADADSE